ncbi:Maf-like protein [Terasakiella brassicae]|uniref:Nucleoside triphosphate pyrophosphatase n=1 Tax=Terasakiella brassicae TaxID=1634917 RepID=A0A917BUH7_9PROT|nr:Maf family nucleotide pyrophosphatase [Terasakiella brassicae]GGF59161.1 Maf-like protein [Terasakiella brassicae]
MVNKIILASASKSRADLLQGAGLDIECCPADLDENLIKSEGLSVRQTALKLSFAKAMAVSEKYPGSYIIGADQMMECEGQRYDKPVDQKEAKKQLMDLRGKIHHLISAVSIVKNGELIWSYAQDAELEMRDFSDMFLDCYLEDIGDDVLTTVGGYRLESKGVQLFSRIEGDYFTILGLPLLALLEFLRSRDILTR